MAINGLYILSKKRYSLNKETFLEIIQLNDLDNDFLKELPEIIDQIFKETHIDENTFSKLLVIIINNPDLSE